MDCVDLRRDYINPGCLIGDVNYQVFSLLYYTISKKRDWVWHFRLVRATAKTRLDPESLDDFRFRKKNFLIFVHFCGFDSIKGDKGLWTFGQRIIYYCWFRKAKVFMFKELLNNFYLYS